MAWAYKGPGDCRLQALSQALCTPESSSPACTRPHTCPVIGLTVCTATEVLFGTQCYTSSACRSPHTCNLSLHRVDQVRASRGLYRWVRSLYTHNLSLLPYCCPAVCRVDVSPDGQFMLVSWIEPPYSFNVPCGRFPMRTQLWRRDGSLVSERRGGQQVWSLSVTVLCLSASNHTTQATVR